MSKINRKQKVPKNKKSETQKAVTPSSITEINLSKEEQENLSNFINRFIIAKNLDSESKPQETIESIVNSKESRKDFENLPYVLLEYLNSCILVGYSVNGERILLNLSKTQQEEDALLEQLRLVFLSMINGGK